MRHPISLAFLTLFDVSALDAIRIAAETGFDKIGLRLLPAAATGEAPYPLMTDDAFAREAAAILKDTGLQTADIEIARLKPDTDIRTFEPFLARGAMLGAQNILVAGDDTDHHRLTETFGAFCRLAKTYNMTADLEFMPWTAVRDLVAARAIVDAAGEDNGGVLIDALHMDRSGTTPAQVATLPASRIHYVQFCDGFADYDRSDEGLIKIARSARLFPGEGAIDLVGLARAIPEGVTISVEVPNHALAKTLDPVARARHAIATTREILARAGRA